MDQMARNHPRRPTRVRHPLEGKNRESKEDAGVTQWDRKLTMGNQPPQVAICIYGIDKDNCHMGGGDRVKRPNRMEKGNGSTGIYLT